MRVLKRGLFFAILAISSPLAALADNMEEGAKLYAAKDYVKAKSALEKAIAEKQNSWKAHLYLGHTLLTLGNFTQAKYQYQLCQRLTTNAAVLAQCTEGISRAEKYLEKRNSSSSSSSSSSTKSDASGAAQDSEKEPELSPKEKRKKALMDEAREKMDKIRAEAKKQIEDEKNGSNQVFKYEDGSRGTDISDEREKEIMKEAEEKCKKIKEDAELRAR
jgi:tetratricopeptide (TPR) repeat protein